MFDAHFSTEFMAPAERFEPALIPFCQESTLIVVVDMSQSSWLVAGIVPGIERPR